MPIIMIIVMLIFVLDAGTTQAAVEASSDLDGIDTKLESETTHTPTTIITTIIEAVTTVIPDTTTTTPTTTTPTTTPITTTRIPTTAHVTTQELTTLPPPGVL